MTREKEGASATLPFINTVEALSNRIFLDQKEKRQIGRVSLSHPFKIPEFYLNLMEKENPRCPIRRQAVPSIEELSGGGGLDPLNESGAAKTPSFIKRYQKRGVFLVNAECAMYCRFCNRRRFVGKGWDPENYREETFQYLEKSDEIEEVIISGGDPFMLSPDEIGYILARLRAIPRIRTIRVSSRIPLVHPAGMGRGHFAALKKASPVWVVIHINHPREISPQFVDVIKRLRGTGAALVSQTVLLRGVNDCPRVIARLFDGLVSCGIKPYYMFQLDEVKGAQHFKVRLSRGIEIMRYLREHCSGLAIPHFALDITGGLGKAPVDHVYVKKRVGKRVTVEGRSGRTGVYLDDGRKSECVKCGLCK